MTRYIPTWQQLQTTPYVAVDFETANRKGGVSACQIALVKVVDGQIVDQLNTLIRPPAEWDHFQFTYLHGITHADVQSAPTWPQAAAQVADFIGASPAYAHNAVFDANVWSQLDTHFGTRTKPQQFFCSYYLARRVLKDLPNYKLPTVVARCAPEFKLNHHEAGSDAAACALIVARLQADVSARFLLS